MKTSYVPKTMYKCKHLSSYEFEFECVSAADGASLRTTCSSASGLVPPAMVAYLESTPSDEFRRLNDEFKMNVG